MSLDKINLDKMTVAVCTLSREGNYLEDTLSSLTHERPFRADRPVFLVLGSPASAYVAHYRQVSGVSLVDMGPSTWAWIENLALRRRATWNYYRCLTQPAGGAGGTLVIEDDVRFARGWLPRLAATVAALKESAGDFALSLYCPWDFPRAAYLEGRLYAEYPLERFYGTQAVYYTAKTRQGFAAYLKKHGVVANREPYDVLLWQYLSEAGLPLFAAAPSLVQHRGTQSTGLGVWHDAPSFQEDVTGPLPETPRSAETTVPKKETK